MPFSWRGGSLPEATLAKIRSFVGANEGSYPYMYLDSRSLVTVGAGYYCATEDQAAQLGFAVRGSGLAATTAQKKAEWQTLRAMATAGAANGHVASYYRSHTTLDLPGAEISRLFDLKLKEFYLDLVDLLPGFDSYPEKAKVALFDMIYNLGEGAEANASRHTRATGLRQFHTLLAACKQHDWAKAASACRRRGPSDSRNDKTKALFNACVAEDKAAAPASPTPAPTTASPSRPAAPQRPAAPPVPTSQPGIDRAPFRQRAPHPLRTLTSPLLKQGARGNDVKAVQRALNRNLAGSRQIATDGVFGPATEAAIRMAQARAHLPQDGVIGPKTLRALDLVLR